MTQEDVLQNTEYVLYLLRVADDCWTDKKEHEVSKKTNNRDKEEQKNKRRKQGTKSKKNRSQGVNGSNKYSRLWYKAEPETL